MSDEQQELRSTLYEIINTNNSENKGTTPTHEILSEKISGEMMKKLKEKYNDNRIIVRCIVTDSSDQAVAYSLSSKKDFGNQFVLRAIDNTFSYTCIICII